MKEHTTEININKTLTKQQHISSYIEQYFRFGSLSRGYTTFIAPMDLVTLIIIFILQIQGSQGDIRRVSMVQNDIWGDGQDRIKTDKGYLYRANINFVDKSSCSFSGIDSDLVNFHGLKFTKCRYAPLRYISTKDMYGFFESSDSAEIFIYFEFIFTDIPIKDFFDYSKNEGKKQICATYKQYKKNQKNDDRNGFNLTHNELEIRMFHIKQMFKENVHMKLLKIDDFINILVEKKLIEMFKTQNKIRLYFFEKFDECLINVKKFVQNLHCLKVVNDIDLKLDKKIDFCMVFPAETTIGVSEFLKRLTKIFNEDHKNLNNIGSLGNDNLNILKIYFNECCDHLKNSLLGNNYMFLIRGKFNIDYFLKEMYNCFKESVKSTQRSYVGIYFFSSKNVDKTLKILIEFIDIHLLELQKKALNDLCESKFFFSHLSKFSEKKIETPEDFISVESLICDYHNILVYIVNLDSTFKNRFEKFNYSKPIFIDENNYKLISGIEIYFDYKPYIKCIKAFYGEDEFLILEKNVHYFFNELNNLYWPSDILRDLNIQEIEVITVNEKNSMRFKVSDYINI